MLNRIFLIAVGLSLFCGGCTQNRSMEIDPKKRLQDYISDSFNIKTDSDRKLLESHLTGEAKSRLTAWSNEQFHKAFIDTKRQYSKLVFREVKTISPKEVHIVYELSYMDQGKGSDARVTTKKLCQLSLENGKWLIREVQSIKELVEYKNEMSLP